MAAESFVRRGIGECCLPFASWPYAIRPPQCLIEAWPSRANDHAGAILITARGFGRIAAATSRGYSRRLKWVKTASCGIGDALSQSRFKRVRHDHHKQVDKGFTLLELMITLGVAAIIATFAMPVYREQVARGHRLDAVTALYRAAQYVESTRTVSSNDSAAKLPLGFDQAPATAQRSTCCECSASRSRTAGIRLRRAGRPQRRMRDLFAGRHGRQVKSARLKHSRRPKWRRAGAAKTIEPTQKAGAEPGVGVRIDGVGGQRFVRTRLDLLPHAISFPPDQAQTAPFQHAASALPAAASARVS